MALPPHMSNEGYEMQYIKEALTQLDRAPGPNVDAFEKELAAWVGAKHAAALSSGTAAIHMAPKAAGVEKGDVVLDVFNLIALKGVSNEYLAYQSLCWYSTWGWNTVRIIWRKSGQSLVTTLP